MNARANVVVVCILTQSYTHNQPKSHKTKFALYICSPDPADCMYVAYGDWMVLHPERPNYRVKGSNWFFPGLIKEKNPTPVITGWLKTYLQDTEASAGGLRPGVSNYLAQFMPVEFIVPVTGHDLRNVSAFYEYIDADITILMAGARALAHWNPPPFGQLGPGPKHAVLDPIILTGVSMDTLDTMMNDFFNLHQNSPPQYQSADWQPDERFSYTYMYIIFIYISVYLYV